MRNFRPASGRSCRRWQLLGWTDRPQRARSTPAGPRAMPPTFADTRRNWSRSRRTSSWPTGSHDRGAVAAGDPHRADRVRRASSIRSAPASSTSLARPGGNATGFIDFEYGMGGKWLELLKEIAPGVTRVAVLRYAAIARRNRPVWRHPVRGAVAQGGGKPGQHARRGRDRARRHGLRARSERRPDRDGERVGAASSRSDRHAGGPAQTARRLLRSLSSPPPAA